MYLRRHHHSSLWNYFHLDLFPTVHQMVWAASTQLVSHFSKIRHGSRFFSKHITIFSIQQINEQPHRRCSFCPKFSASTPILPQHSSTNGNSTLLVDTNSLPTPTSGRRGRRETSPSPPLPPASSNPYQRPRTHTYASHFLSTLSIAPSPWPALLSCNNEFFLNQNVSSLSAFD